MVREKLTFFDNIVYAPNVHQGGGKSLLLDLINKQRHDTLFIIDRRLLQEDASLRIHQNIISIKCNFLDKIFMDYKLWQFGNENKTFLYFSNIPPIFGLRGKCLLFLQNRYLIERYTLIGLKPKVVFRILVERIWFRRFITNVDQIIVQSQSMFESLKKVTGKSSNISVWPLMNPLEETSSLETRNKRYDFVYIASAEPHKNHVNLIQAWNKLAQIKLFPSLILTFDSTLFPNVQSEVTRSTEVYGTRIKNFGSLDRKDVVNLYRESKYLIYPSKFESFGLPLLEAQSLGLKIVASELDYVRDLLNPEQTFDPHSSLSIMRSVERIYRNDVVRNKVYTADEFMNLVFG